MDWELIATPPFPCVPFNGDATRKPATIARWPGGFFRYQEIYPDGLRRWWLGNRRVAGAGQCRAAPVHRK